MLKTDVRDEYSLVTPRLADTEATIIRSVEHALRTPIGIILGYAELLHDGQLGQLAPEQQQAIFAIANRAYELRTVVERINTLLATDRRAIYPQTFNLAEIVTKVLAQRQTNATQAGVTIIPDTVSDLSFISGDIDQIRQAVDCLVESALKATPREGRIKIELKAEPGQTVLKISHDGLVQSKSQFDHLKFNSSSAQETELGLGLMIATAIVEAHNGQIEIESQMDRSHQFTIKLPSLPVTATTAQTIKHHPIAPRRILIVDDEETVAVTLQEGLNSLPNCEVVTTTKTKQALRLFEEQRFDLLITDYKMPVMDGLNLATHIRRMSPKVAIIIITAHNDSVLRERASMISVEHVLNKPVRLTEIRSIALEVLASDAYV